MPTLQLRPGDRLLTAPWYRNYVLAILTLCYVSNVMDRSQILAAALEEIKHAFGASDFQMGMLSGLPFALFYSFVGVPVAAWADRSSRRNVLAVAVAAWSATTALFGAAATYTMGFVARVGTAIGEAGGGPPSHSLISDYFPKLQRGTAFAVFALAVPIGTSLGAAFGGWGVKELGWRTTFVVAGVPGLVLALLVVFTVREPPRGLADGLPASRRPGEDAGDDARAAFVVEAAVVPSPGSGRRAALGRVVCKRLLQQLVSEAFARNVGR